MEVVISSMLDLLTSGERAPRPILTWRRGEIFMLVALLTANNDEMKMWHQQEPKYFFETGL